MPPILLGTLTLAVLGTLTLAVLGTLTLAVLYTATTQSTHALHTSPLPVALILLALGYHLFTPALAPSAPETPATRTSAPQHSQRFPLPSWRAAGGALALMGAGAWSAHAGAWSAAAVGALVLALACGIELASPALYSILSCAIPVAMAAHLAVTGHLISLVQLGAFVPLSLLYIGIPMSVCLHRYFAHQAFRTSRPVQFVLGVVACLAWQGGPLWWAIMHLRHHKHCDTPRDPHSAAQQGTVYAFIGWMANPDNYRAETVDAYRELDAGLRVPEMLLVQKLNPLPPILLCLVASHCLGYANMVWCVLGPMLNARLTTLLFNVHFHPREDATHACRAVDDARVLAQLVGESRHRDHHLWPRRARRKDWDVPWWLTLSWMQATGLVWDCKYTHV